MRSVATSKVLVIVHVLTFALRISAFFQGTPRGHSFHFERRHPNRLLRLQSTSTPDDVSTVRTNNRIGLEKNVGAYLVSFPELYQIENGNAKISNTSKTMRAWKEYCLGDGGVYFDQRPKALKALNTLLSMEIATYLQRQLDGDDYENKNELTVEAAVLSTCARFEILVTVEKYSRIVEANVDDTQPELLLVDSVQQIVVNIISEQICFQRRRKRYMLQTLLPFTILDLPSRIRNNIPEPKSSKANTFLHEYSKNLFNEVLITEGVYNVSKRLCMIAAGLQDRPVFRPFSARDSHVMQQIKRTADGTLSYTTKVSETSSKSTYCKLLFDSALQSGKACRSPKALPILDELREASSGADGPEHLSRKAAKSAETLAIIPTVNNCVSKFKSIEASNSILDLREGASMLVKEAGLDFGGDECKGVRKLLHEPTMKLREGQHVDIAQVLRLVDVEVSTLLHV
jgi:hypothetical protein